MDAGQFRSAWWLPGAHAQTLFGAGGAGRAPLATERERVELSDGDFVDVDLCGPPDGPLIALVPGFGGSARAPYMRGAMAALTARGYRCAAMNHRGCSGEPNRRPCLTHHGSSRELHEVLERFARLHPGGVLGLVGFSMGGSMVLRWLGEEEERACVRGAIAVSVAFDLRDASARLDRGFNRVYQNLMLKRVIRMTRRLPDTDGLGIDRAALDRLRTFRQFDECVTAPLHGFASAEDFYEKGCCSGYLERVRVPTLVIQAKDDPFCSVRPAPDRIPSAVALELTAGGGHMGFVAGGPPKSPRYWLDERITAFFDTVRAAQAPLSSVLPADVAGAHG